MPRNAKRLNLGCGNSKLRGFLNIDLEESVKPDLVHDFRMGLPFESNSVEKIYFIHTIEHIEEKFHFAICSEIFRVLKHDGLFVCSFPEFLKVAKNYETNYLGKREFWKHTIYGRQLYKSDYHIALMDSIPFKQMLINCGFKRITHHPEKREDWNTVFWAFKGQPPVYYDEALKNAIWDK